MSESDKKVFSFGIGGFSQRRPSLEIRGDGDAYSYRHSASLLADTEERRGTLEKSKVDAPMTFLRDLDAYDCREDWRRTAVEAGRNFLHDIRCLRARKPRVREPWRHSGATWAGTRYRADRESGHVRSGCEAACVLHNRSREIRSTVRRPNRHLLGKPFASYVDFLSCHPADPKRVPGRRRRPS